MARNADDKLALIEAIVELWTEESNDEEGDKYLSDSVLAMEAVDDVLHDNDTSGALRGFTEALANRRI